MKRFSGSAKSSGRYRSPPIALLVGALVFAPAASAQQEDVLEEIIVKARKSSENLQSVPVAMSAFTADDLLNRSIFGTSDLMGSSPNLQVTSAYAQTQPNFTIRGIGVANEFTAPTASAVGVYVDEVYQTFRASHGMQLYDLQQVEILRGPQGTLFGKNTTGGAVLLETRRPNMEGRDGYLTVGLRNFSGHDLEGAYEDTIGDSIGFRLAGLTRQADGYTHNPIDGLDYGQLDSSALRLSVRWDASDRLQGNFSFNYADNESRGDLPYGIGYLEGGRNILAVDPVTGMIIPQVPGLRTGLAQDEVASNSGNGYSTNSKGAAMTWRYSVGDFEFVSITGYDEGEFHLSPFDCDGSAVNVCATRYYTESKSISQDLRLHWESESTRVILGVYIADEEVKTANEVDGFGFLNDIFAGIGIPDSFFNPPIASNDSLGIVPDGTPACGAIVLNPVGFFDARSFLDPANCQGVAPPYSSVRADQDFTIERPTKAIYGELNLELGADFGLTFGLRHTWDDVNYVDARTIFLSADGVARASTVPYSFPYDPNLPAVDQRENSSEWSGRLMLDRQFTDSIFAYVGYSRGYRAGTYNGLAYQDIEQVYFVEPETVDAWEAGLKTRFANNRVQLNAAAFTYKYKNQQIAEIVGLTSFLRAVDGELWGGEVELIALLSDRLTLAAELGLMKSKYDDNQVLFGGGALFDIGGNEFANAPGETFSTSLDWDIGNFMDGTVSATVNLQYMGEYFFDPFGDYDGQYVGSPSLSGAPLASLELGGGNPSYWLTNARLRYQSDKMDISAWVKNATDEFYFAYGINLNSLFQDYMTRGMPRTYGLQATFYFN
jgi:iron complex outermembrane receptor protein